MSKLISITRESLDGDIAETGGFDRLDPEKVHAFITELLRPIGTHLYATGTFELLETGVPAEGGRR